MNMISTEIEKQFLRACEAIEFGTLRVQTPDGARHDFGTGGDTAEIAIHDWAVVSMALARGDIGFGEAYIQGLWDSEAPETLIALFLRNQGALASMRRPNPLNRIKYRFIDQVLRRNSRAGSRGNIRAHYDVGNEFYMRWLDDSMTYSSALFAEGDDLPTAQARKYDRILDRLGEHGEQVLEIGCGWGGFAERAADRGRQVTGLTLSQQQKAYADARLDGRAKIAMRDYRDAHGRYDHIVSIEMIEAVGERYWPIYFQKIKTSLAEAGKAVIQAITVPDADFARYRKGSDFIRHYTFPGGMLLSNAQIANAASRAGLRVSDSFAFGHDYGRTCAIWSANMQSARDQIAKLGYDARFLRSWRFYLDACAASFKTDQVSVVQVELQHAQPA